MKKLLCLAAVLSFSFAGCEAPETPSSTVGNPAPATVDTAPPAVAPTEAAPAAVPAVEEVKE